MSFDPSRLQGMDSSFDESYQLASGGSSARVTDAEVRGRLGALALASRIVGIATANAAEMSDSRVLASMELVFNRLHDLRTALLRVVGVQRGAQEYRLVFNVVTAVALDFITEEWKWSRLSDEPRLLPPEVLAELAQRCDAFAGNDASSPVLLPAHVRETLLTLRCAPKIYALINHFDYFQADHDAMATQLLYAVAEEAGHACSLFVDPSMDAASQWQITDMMHSLSTGLMCEVFKSCAAADVTELRSLQSHDRSVVLAQYESQKGMPFRHVLTAHRKALARMLDTANLILETRRTPKRGQ